MRTYFEDQDDKLDNGQYEQEDPAPRELDVDADGEPLEPGYCPNCSGSGEGQHDGSRCWACKGTGEQR